MVFSLPTIYLVDLLFDVNTRVLLIKNANWNERISLQVRRKKWPFLLSIALVVLTYPVVVTFSAQVTDAVYFSEAKVSWTFTSPEANGALKVKPVHLWSSPLTTVTFPDPKIIPVAGVVSETKRWKTKMWPLRYSLKKIKFEITVSTWD